MRNLWAFSLLGAGGLSTQSYKKSVRRMIAL
jgi:hypothetical protein